MNASNENSPEAGSLAQRQGRLASLHAAYAALAPSALTDAGRTISDAGRTLTQRLADASGAEAAPSPELLVAIDASLAEFESAMRQLALGVPITQLRSTLPARLGSDRRSVLALLDLLLDELDPTTSDWANRLGTLDYLITLLCTNGAPRPGGVIHDPIALTPRLAQLGRSAEQSGDPRLDECEAEFFAAANMDRSELREEFQRRTLRQKKVELGLLFFAPRVLRAILTYNAALLQRVTDEILEAADWGQVTPSGSSEEGTSCVSVFASKPLQRLAGAVRARARGEGRMDSPEARIAAALELEQLDRSTREALCESTIATPSNPIATAILIGAMCRKLTILSFELQEIGIDPDQVADVWALELDELFEREIDAKHADGAFKQAYALAELRNELLLQPVTDRLREEREVVQRSIRRPRSSAGTTSSRALPESFSPPAAETPGIAATATPSAPSDPSSAPPAKKNEAPDLSTPSSVSRTRPAAAASAAIAAPASPTASTAPAAPAANGSRGAAAASAPARSPDTRKRGRARDLVREALEDDRKGRAAGQRRNAGRASEIGARVAAAALVLVALAGVAYFHYSNAPGRDLQAFSAEQLEVVSPYLVEGHRNGLGHGPGFVGTLDERWTALSEPEREATAEAMVERLRQHGLAQVMIYDRTRRLRIQALGSQPTRAL